MNSWKVILATVVIFGAGVMTGGFLVGNVQHLHWKNFHHTETASTNSVFNLVSQATNQPAGRQRMPEILSKQFLQQLDEKLHLAPDQHEAIQKIITDGQNLMRKTVQDARLEIREQLTPDQQTEFDKLVKRLVRRQANFNSTNAPPVLSQINSSVTPTNAQ